MAAAAMAPERPGLYISHSHSLSLSLVRSHGTPMLYLLLALSAMNPLLFSDKEAERGRSGCAGNLCEKTWVDRPTQRAGLFADAALCATLHCTQYRVEKMSWYVVARNFVLLLLNFSAWPCLRAA